MKFARSVVSKLLDKAGFFRYQDNPILGDNDPVFARIYQACKPRTMTSLERMYGLYKAVCYVHAHEVPGDIVECGVWRGGSSMLVASTLYDLGSHSRTLYLYDTFAGMSEPTDRDKTHAGDAAMPRWREQEQDGYNEWDYSPIEDVRAGMAETGYPSDRIRFVRGKVEVTIPGVIPDRISVLRLDTDWYESTRHELEHLFPRLSAGGVLIIDDYGHWDGARAAVDEYMANNGIHILLNRMDYTGRIGIKM